MPSERYGPQGNQQNERPCQDSSNPHLEDAAHQQMSHDRNGSQEGGKVEDAPEEGCVQRIPAQT
jgi:hypothetical protein